MSQKKKKRSKIAKVLGRDPAMGRVSFKSGVILTRKDKEKNRKSKLAKRLANQEKDE
jgi:hypothetical protein